MRIEKIFKIIVDSAKSMWYYNYRNTDRDTDEYIPTVTIINGYNSQGKYNTVRIDVK